jgi:PAS domain-containing protein
MNAHVALASQVPLTPAQRAAKTEARLERFLDSTLDLICAINRDGVFTEVSGASRTILAYEPGELLGRPYRRSNGCSIRSAGISRRSSICASPRAWPR